MNPPHCPHPDADRVYACPDCDRAGQLHLRQDGMVRCYNCKSEFGSLDAITERPDRRGCNFTDADKQRFAGSPPEHYNGPAEGGGSHPKYGP